ncbi:argonaute/piwi family protein [Sphingopyxis alaskensis]|jgi:hypothetical protein|uniref:argonaute/piwi family protein n=1 Tax=Sphingopyxis alaskensis TaxID=117207 RepID=UPI0019BBA1F0|nr:hypothetical protein [Sphingopyxis alaskensis]MBD3744827.1 hypothetical protein [Sphingopyxis terrae]MCM3418777.1 hypothetical protein [Sphingopyxis alaskensis]
MKFPETSLVVEHFHEPELEFAAGQRSPHPKDGLFLYGPHAKARKIRDIRVGVIGTTDGIAHFRSWGRKLKQVVAVPPPGKGEKQDRLHLANFPGLAEAFGISFEPDECVTLSIPIDDIDKATRIENLNEAVDKVARLYIERVRKHRRNEEEDVDLWVLVLPEIVYDRCRPGSKRTGLPLEIGDFRKRQKARADLPLLASAGVIDQSNEDIFDDVPDFHRRIKAEFLTIAPTQLVRETTLAPEAFKNKAGYPLRKTQDAATVAWNLATGLYYKTQPKPPWRLADVRPGVCYIGMVYKSLPQDPDGHACCAAQMFLNEGDGVVFRGANGPWKTGDYEYHLKKDAAKKLLGLVLETYRAMHDGPPKELFIHGQTYFNDEEWGAFCEAAPKGTNVIGVRIRSTGGETKLFRDGDYPVLRGTALLLDDRTAYLWTTGYVPQLDTYIGPETPNPLHITVMRSKKARPDIRTVLADIMGLTKINYNSCNFNDGLPVTVRFARMVGDVLTMGSAKGQERQPFKFYV